LVVVANKEIPLGFEEQKQKAFVRFAQKVRKKTFAPYFNAANKLDFILPGKPETSSF